jgi:hypothetical protein
MSLIPQNYGEKLFKTAQEGRERTIETFIEAKIKNCGPSEWAFRADTHEIRRCKFTTAAYSARKPLITRQSANSGAPIAFFVAHAIQISRSD